MCLPYREVEPEPELCDLCGIDPATVEREAYDACPTDRGEERRYYTVKLCDECDYLTNPQWMPKRYRNL